MKFSDIFASGESETKPPSPERQKELIEKIAKKVFDLRLSAPAIFFLESMKPLSFLGSQVLVFFQPIFHSFFSLKEYDEITMMLEERENVERLICEIEKLEGEEREVKTKERSK
ncbi:MAG: hypothetical protein AB1393_07765 [Candidatus Edwardsbacteria bacterium]